MFQYLMEQQGKEDSSCPRSNRETVEELLRAYSEKAEIKPVSKIGEHTRALFPKL